MPRRHRLRDRAVEERLVDDRRRPRRIPEHGDPVLGHPEVGQHREEARAAVLGVLAGVVGDAEGRCWTPRPSRARAAQAHARTAEIRHMPLLSADQAAGLSNPPSQNG